MFCKLCVTWSLFSDCLESIPETEWSEDDYEEYLIKLAASRRPSIFWKERLLIIPEEENEDDILDNKTKRGSINKVESKRLDTIVEISTSTNDSTSIVHKVQTHSVPVNLQASKEQSEEENFSTSIGTDCKSYEMKTFTSCSSNPSQTISDNNKIPISAL